MAWFDRFKKQTPAPPQPVEVDEWLFVPFRFAEAARVTIHTICNQPEVPLQLRFWIQQWLDEYSYQLVAFMKENYGSGILPVLDKITEEVLPDEAADDDNPPWDRWERQFTEDK
jgi:hypothetical protein